MAFLTGVDLEAQLREEEDDARQQLLALPPPRRATVAPAPQLALQDHSPRRKSLDYGTILKNAMDLHTEDPLDELRRMIKRTQTKMDSQTKVLHGFMTDVNQIRGLDRNFSCTDLAVATPSGSHQPALTAGKSMALTAGKSMASLQALQDLTPGKRPSSASGKTIRGPKRCESLRSLPHSSSQPALPSTQRLGFRSEAPLVMPARRAPPGAPQAQPLRAKVQARRTVCAAELASTRTSDGVRCREEVE